MPWRRERIDLISARVRTTGSRRVRADEFVQVRELPVEDPSIEEEQRGKRLILRRGADVAVHGEIRQESVDLRLAHLLRMALAVEEDEALDPGDVRLLGAEAVVLRAQRDADTIEQTRLLRGDGRGDRDDFGHGQVRSDHALGRRR